MPFKFLVGAWKWLYLTILIGCSQFVVAQDTNTDITIVADEWRPMHFLDESGRPKGALYELAKFAFDNAGISYNIVEQPFARALKTAKQQKNVVMLSVGRHANREQQYRWLTPIYTDSYMAVTLKTRDDVQIETPEDLTKYTLGVVRGYPLAVLSKALKSRLKVVEVTSTQQMWDLLRTGRVDYVFSTKNLASFEAEYAGLAPSQIRGAFEFENESLIRVYAITSKNTSSETAQKIRQALTQVIDSEYYDALMARWQINAISLAQELHYFEE